MNLTIEHSHQPVIGKRGAVSMMGFISIKADDGSVVWLKIDAPSKGHDTWTDTHRQIADLVLDAIKQLEHPFPGAEAFAALSPEVTPDES